MINRALIAATTLSAIAISSVASASGPNNNQPITQADILVSNGGTVSAYMTDFDFGGWPSYNNNAFGIASVSSPLSSATLIGLNHAPTTSANAVSLGSYNAGQEVLLALGTDFNGGNAYSASSYDNVFFTGAGSRNADGEIHAYITTIDSNTCRVDFEDLPKGGSDWNYGDASIMVSGVHSQAVPEPASFAVLGLGFIGLARRRSKK